MQYAKRVDSSAEHHFVSLYAEDWSQRLLGLPLRNLALVKVPELVDAGSLAGCNALGKLDKAANGCSPRDGVLCCLGLNPDDSNAGVLWATVMLAVTKVTDPRLQGW